MPIHACGGTPSPAQAARKISGSGFEFLSWEASAQKVKNSRSSSVRLKLIYGLGVINRQEYEDAELLMALREELNHDGNEYAFTDDEILGPFGELHCVAALPPPPQFEPADSSLYAMQIQRYQQAVRSTMVLSLTELISKISLKKAFQK